MPRSSAEPERYNSCEIVEVNQTGVSVTTTTGGRVEANDTIFIKRTTFFFFFPPSFLLAFTGTFCLQVFRITKATYMFQAPESK